MVEKVKCIDPIPQHNILAPIFRGVEVAGAGPGGPIVLPLKL